MSVVKKVPNMLAHRSTRVDADEQRKKAVAAQIAIWEVAKKKGYTQKDIALKLGVSTQRVCHICSGKNLLRIDTFNQFVEACGGTVTVNL